MIFITLGSDPPPLESDKNIFYFFLDTRPFFEHFLKKCFLPLENLKTLFSKFAKNELKAVKVAALHAAFAILSGMLAAPCGMTAAPHGVSAPPDSHGNSRRT